MDPTTIVEKAYKLIYLVDVPEAVEEATILLSEDWKKYVREILYEIAFVVYKGKAYKTIRDVLILDVLKLLYKLDREDINDTEIIKDFVKLVHMYVSHSLRNRIDLISNKEKWNAIYTALNEFDTLIKQWDQ
jgi:hypothetical protein